MTLETCIKDLNKVFDKTFTYDGGKVIIDFYDHDEAFKAIRNARTAIAEITYVSEVGNK